MLSATKNFSAPETGYDWLFGCDEARLAAGSGSDLLDAFLLVPVEERSFHSQILNLPAYQAIRAAADPAQRNDVYARLCALTLVHDYVGNRLQINRESLSALRLLLSSDMTSLPSALVFDLLRHDRSFAERGYFSLADTCSGYTLDGVSHSLMTLAIKAGEDRLDPQFARLLASSVDHFERDFAKAQTHVFEKALALAQLCLKALGREGETLAAARAFHAGMQAVDDLLARWKAELPPELWSYIAEKTSLERQESGGVAALVKKMIDQPPRQRGELVETLWRLTREAAEKAPGLPWTYDALLGMKRNGFDYDLTKIASGGFREIWEALVAKPCEFSPDFALTLVESLDRYSWPRAIVFARSLAASLPRSDEARAAIEHRFLREVAHHHSQTRRELERQHLILREALAEASSTPTLEQRAVAAQAAFVTAYEKARQSTLEEAQSMLELGESRPSEQEDWLATVTWFRRLMSDPVLGGPGGRRDLLRLAAEAIKAGPVTEALTRRIDKIEEGFEFARQGTGLDIARGSPDLKTRASWLFEDYAGIDQIRALMDLCAPLTPAERETFLAIEDFAAHTPAAAAPSKKWIKDAQALAQAPEVASTRRLLLALMSWPYFTEPDKAQSPLLGHSVTLRRGLIWLCAFWPGEEVIKPLSELALRTLAPSQFGGLTNEILGNACLWSLAQLGGGAGLSALARIGARSRYPKVRQRINALFEEAARKAGRPRVEIEEEIAPHHGFDAEGVSIVALAESAGQAEIRLGARGKAEIVWRDAGGKALKAPSDKMKQADAAGVKSARDATKEIEADYGVELKRVEKLYRRDRTLDFARWREFYVEHPFLGPMCRRLIWRAEGPEGAVAGLWRDCAFTDVAGKAHDVSRAKLKLWHPLGAEEGEIAAWRDRLESLGVDQPFRQAWRETYRVTEAERATGFYSNRFAGHIVRQHQFMTLARLNDWSCRHRMWQDVENDEPTYVSFPEFGVYAEFWTEGAGGRDDPPVAESTAYLYLSTDRIVFHRLNPEAPQNKPAEMRGERLPVDEVPPLAFSEIMRCCDLFVSVATIARDPNWLDRGENAEHPNQWRQEANRYWNAAATAELAASGQIRREILARALPALGLGERMSLDERHLCVRGAKGEYRVHLGSGAAFRADGQHICIVPDGVPKKLALPYEGDDTLALILSKAMLLLRDDKITDPVILRQLKRG